MTSTNLALVFGSALLKKGASAKRESRKTRLGIDHYVASVSVVRAMIDNWDVLFQVGGSFGHTHFTALSLLFPRQGRVLCASLRDSQSRQPQISQFKSPSYISCAWCLQFWVPDTKEYRLLKCCVITANLANFVLRCLPIFRSRLLSVCGNPALKPLILSDAGI